MKRTIPLILAASLLTGPAVAHPGDHVHSLAAGFSHPLFGADHLLAMVLVGLWAAVTGGQRRWVWPAAFVAAMVAGGLAGVSGLSLPFAETAISVSVVVLGGLAALSLRLPVVLGAALIAGFGFTHGFAHGVEAAGANFGLYALGFVGATAGLHVLGLVAARLAGDHLARFAGGRAALAGLGRVLA